MSLGTAFKKRMLAVNMGNKELSEKTGIPLRTINNKIGLDNIDKFNFALLCSALHCKAEFFTDPSIRERDLLVSAINRGGDDYKSRAVKIKIQDFINDFSFANKILSE